MRKSNAVVEVERNAPAVRLELVAGQQLVVERAGEADLVTLVAGSGQIVFSVHVTESGPVLRFDRGLAIEARGTLELAGRRVAIRGEDGVSIESGADAAIEVAGDLTSNARIQNIRARLGNVNLKANDDVKVVGERILLNC